MEKRIGNIAILLLMLMLVTATTFGQIPNGIVNGLKTGDAKAVAAHFNENLELVVLDKETVCSRAQGEQILRDFFSKNKPSDFKIKYDGGDDVAYAIGEMVTSGGNFRIYFLLKSVGNTPKIVQLRIEKD